MDCKRIKTGLLALLAAVLCSGCLAHSADSLYALPRQSDAYYDLQKAIDTLMEGSSVYAAPVSGSNQQPVQLADLDGDQEDEAIVFLKSSGEKPLKICIFDKQNDSYENVAIIEGDGSAFDRVEYVDLDGRPGQELLVGRQVSNQVLRSLGVYSYRDSRMMELLSVNYSEFLTPDLDEDKTRDVFVLRLETEERGGVAELYRCRDGQLEREQEASLSVGVKSVRRIISGEMCPGVPAVFVASAYGEDSIITDIFAFDDQTFKNVSFAAETGLSTQTVRNYNAYATDIDDDGVIELPSLVVLPSMEAEDTYWMIDWYNLYPDGNRQVKQSTYHSYYGGWYLTLPGYWHGNITVTRGETELAGVRGLVFSRWNGRETAPEEILTIYALTGEDRWQLAEADGRFILAEKGETVYCALLSDTSWAKRLSQDDVKDMFHFIRINWNSGEIGS